MGKNEKPRKKTRTTLLGRELRLRRGNRSYAAMARLSESPPLAARVEPISVSSLHKIESGQRMPSVETLRTLSMLYGLTVEHMIRLIEAERLADLEPEGETWDELIKEAECAVGVGDYRGAFAAALRAEEVAPDPRHRVTAAGTKATALWRLGMPWEAASTIFELLARPETTEEQKAAFFYHLAEIYRSLWNLTVAEVFGRHGMELAGAYPNSATYAALQHLVGNILLDRAEMDPSQAERFCREALRHYEKAEKILLELDLADQAAVARTNMGAAHRVEGNYLLAFQRLREGLAASRRCRNRRGIALSLRELGKAYREVGEWPKARRHLLEAEAESAAAGFVDIQFQALVHLLEGAREAGEPSEGPRRRARVLLPFLEDRSPERVRFEKILEEEKAAEGGMV